MKTILTLIALIFMVMFSFGQEDTPEAEMTPAELQAKTAALVRMETAITRMRSLEIAKIHAAQGKKLKVQKSLAALMSKEFLLAVKAEADRPKYQGSAAARRNIWQTLVTGKLEPGLGK